MKFSLYSKKNRLDEMQEQTLRKIESRGFWLMWGSLLAAWIVQTVFGAADKAAGEWVVFMIGCIYTGVACHCAMVWGSRIRPPANAVWFWWLRWRLRLICGFSRGYWVGAVLPVFLPASCALHCCMCAALTRKRREHLMTGRTEKIPSCCVEGHSANCAKAAL